MDMVYCVLVNNVKFDFSCDGVEVTLFDKKRASKAVEGKCFDVPIVIGDEDIDTYIADVLTANSGWCVVDFEYRIVATHEEDYHVR